MLTSTQSGFFDDPATWGSTTNTPDTAPEDWTIDVGHTVTIRPGHGHEDRNSTGIVAGNLVIGDVDSSNFSVRMNTLIVQVSGTVHVRGGCSIGLASVMICMGDLNLEGSIGNAIGISDSQSWLFPIDPIFSGDARTIHVNNPQNIGNANLAYGYAVEYGGAPLSGYGSMPPGNRWFNFTYSQAPMVVAASSENIDLNTLAPGGDLSDFGFGWDMWNDSGMPLVFALADGALLPVPISITWISDAQWEWSFTSPSDIPFGRRLIVVTAHGTASGYKVQYMRAVIAASPATAADVTAAVQTAMAQLAASPAIVSRAQTSVGLNLVSGDDYLATDGRAILFGVPAGSIDLSDAALVMEVSTMRGGTPTGELVVSITGSLINGPITINGTVFAKAVQMQPTHAQTAALTNWSRSTYAYRVRATWTSPAKTITVVLPAPVSATW